MAVPKKIDLFATVKKLINSGDIKTFTEIFDNIPYTRVAKAIGFHNDRMKDLITPTGMIHWNLADLIILSGKFDIDVKQMLDLIYATYAEHRIKIKLPKRKTIRPAKPKN